MTKPVLPPDLADNVAPATILVRGGAVRSPHDETCEALFLTSGFVYDDAAAAEAAFAQEGSRYVYSRYRNPTVAMFEERLRLLEGAEACRATASGMAAVFAALLCRLRAGHRVVSSRALFGSCRYIVAELLPRWRVRLPRRRGRAHRRARSRSPSAARGRRRCNGTSRRGRGSTPPAGRRATGTAKPRTPPPSRWPSRDRPPRLR